MTVVHPPCSSSASTARSRRPSRRSSCSASLCGAPLQPRSSSSAPGAAHALAARRVGRRDRRRAGARAARVRRALHGVLGARRPRAAGAPPARAAATLRAQLLPIDAPWAVRAFLASRAPSAAVFVESDVWPTVLTSCAARRIPVALICARISIRPTSRWQTFAPPLARAAFSTFRLVSAQTAPGAERLAFLGAENASIAPSLKFLTSPPALQSFQSDALLPSTKQRPVWVAASAHVGEESVILEAHHALMPQSAVLNPLLLLAPRHPWRRQSVMPLARAAAFDEDQIALRSKAKSPAVSSSVAAHVADALGELPLLYRAASVALIGNSFTPSGQGHNFAEAAHYGLPIAHGPYFRAFRPLVDDVFNVMSKQMLQDSQPSPGGASCWLGPCMQVQSADDIEKLILEALVGVEATRERGAALKQAVAILNGHAVGRAAEIITQLLAEGSQNAKAGDQPVK